jgi:putative SOS response-associated peptidase YedK
MTYKDRLALAQELGVIPDQLPEDYKPRYNIAPTQSHLIVTLEREDRAVHQARWGLIPSWSKDNKNAYKTINARAETVEKSPAYRSAFKRRRCLVPADGFYEWQGEKGNRQPYWFHRPDGKLLYFAGLYEDWYPEGKENPPETTFTIITTDANEYLSRIHNRMPVILDDEAQEVWLFPGEANVPDLKALLKPAPEDALAARPVSKEVNNARNQGPELLDEIILDEPAY